MTLLRNIVATSALSALPALALAQDISGAVTLGYGHSDISGISEDIRSTTLDFGGRYDFGNGFSVGGDLSAARLDIDNVPVDLDVRAFGLDAGYRFSSGFTIGAYAEKAELDIETFPVDLSATSYGISAGYGTAYSDFGVFIGETETDPDLPPGVDIRDIGLTFGFRPTEGAMIGGNWIKTELSDGVTDVDITALGVAGSYAVNDAVSLFGGVTRTSIDLLDADVTTFGIGAGYDLGAITKIPGAISLELARSDLSAAGGSVDVDTVRLGYTIPLGGAAGAPRNSVASSILDPRHSAVTSTVLSAF